MSHPSKIKGTAFENRCVKYLLQLGAYKAERIPLSGNSIYSKYQGDIIWDFVIDEDNVLNFRSECKKRNDPKSFQFETGWLTDIVDKANKTNCVGSVLLSGKFRPIYTVINEQTYYSLFGNYNAVKIIPYKSRGKTNITINWDRSDKLLGGDGRSLKARGQWKAGKGYTKKVMKIVKFEAEIGVYLMLLDDFVLSLKHSLGFAETRYF